MRLGPIEEGRRWLEQAREDLRRAEDLAGRGGYHVVCFLAKQVGEKALRVVPYAEGEELVLGHSIERLLREASRYDPDLPPRVRRWSILDGYYVSARYPNRLPEHPRARVHARSGLRRRGPGLRDRLLRRGTTPAPSSA